MAKENKRKEPNQPAEDVLKRMNKALKKMLDTPPETHHEMVIRKRKITRTKINRD